MSGSRNMVITVAFEKSVSNRSAFMKLRLLADAFLGGVALRQLDHVGVVFDALRRGAALGRGDDGAAIAGAEVVHGVGRRDLGHVEHLVDQRLRRRHPDHVLAGLTDLRLERLVLSCASPTLSDSRTARDAAAAGRENDCNKLILSSDEDATGATIDGRGGDFSEPGGRCQ